MLIKIPAQRKNKYRNKKCIINGITFHSIKEGKRYADLLLMQKAGEIFKLKLQVPFKISVNNMKICTYKADFVYYDKSGNRIVEDSKGALTKDFRIKQKLMKAVFDIDILLS